MPANVQKMVYVGEVPWHRMGSRLAKQDRSDMSKVLQRSGLSFEVEKLPLWTNIQGEQVPVPQAFATIRKDTGDILGVVGRQYTVVQNREGFAPFESLCGEGGALYETAGVLGKGERVWVLAKLPDNIELRGGDLVDKYLLYSNSHNGSGTAKLALTPIRVVCENTLSLAIRSAELSFSIMHKASAHERLDKATEQMGLVNKTYEQARKLFEAMTHTRVTKALSQTFIEDLLPVRDEGKGLTDSVLAKRKMLADLQFNGKGQDLISARGTLWGLYNAATEYADHVLVTASRSDDKQLKSLWFGKAQRFKKHAFTMASRLVA